MYMATFHQNKHVLQIIYFYSSTMSPLVTTGCKWRSRNDVFVMLYHCNITHNYISTSVWHNIHTYIHIYIYLYNPNPTSNPNTHTHTHTLLSIAKRVTNVKNILESYQMYMATFHQNKHVLQIIHYYSSTMSPHLKAYLILVNVIH